MQRVFVIDYEIVSPLGIGKEAVWSSIVNNYLAGARIEQFDPGELAVFAAAEVKGDISFPHRHLPGWVGRHVAHDRGLELLLACHHMIEERAKGVLELVSPARAGLCFGSGQDISFIELLTEKVVGNIDSAPPDSVSDFLHAALSSGIDASDLIKYQDLASVYLAHVLKLRAFNNQYLTACSASNQAVAFAYRAIQQDTADIVIAAGADSVLNLVAYTSLAKLGIFVQDDFPPERSCRPLDSSRRGTLIGEAAGMIILANEKIVDALGFTPQLEIIGAGNTVDGYKITSPDPEANGMSRAIKSALGDAGIEPENVDYIQLHGTGTISNDPLELKAIADVFQESANSLSVSSTKDRHGHAVEAAGIQELIILFEAMNHDIAPCTVNLQNPIEAHGINLIQGENISMNLNLCLNYSFAFGGINSVLAVQKVV